MIDPISSNRTIGILEKALGAAGLAHEVISHNIANVETPGFKRSEVIFQERLAAALAAAQDADRNLKGAVTDPRHFSIGEVPSPENVEPSVVVRAETSLRPDGNNVDIDSEMVKLAENTLLYQALAQLIKTKIAGIRSAINEGRR